MRWRSGLTHRWAQSEKVRRESAVHGCTQSVCDDRWAEIDSGGWRNCSQMSQTDADEEDGETVEDIEQ
jgi:hypothetical protein